MLSGRDKKVSGYFRGTKNGFVFCQGVYKGLRRVFQENLKRLLIIHQEWGVWFTDLHYLSAVPVGVVVYR